MKKLQPRIVKPMGGRRMKADAVLGLVTEMTDLQKLSLLQLLKIGASSSEVHSIVLDCRDRGLDVDGTLAEVLRRFSEKSVWTGAH